MRKLQTLCRNAIVIVTWSGFPALATVYDSDGSSASVQGLQNAALNGDTITIPPGIFTWSIKVTVTKAITLKGSGIGVTILKDNVQNPSQLLLFTLASGLPTRLTGIE